MKRAGFVALCLALTALFVGLGIWQVERRAWKLDLIEKVEGRVHAAPSPLPAREQWNGDLAYRRVRVTGTFLHDRETLVQALTALGGGWWVVTPLRTAAGTILVNRGYVPDDKRDPATRLAAQPVGEVSVTGLIRTTEPGGGFLRSNDPAGNRWFSRDVAAIAKAKRLGAVIPFFIDADATPNPGGYPVGGLTVIAFNNNHLGYALTWFSLAVLCVGGVVMVIRSGRRGGSSNAE
ncbi:SURF1 family protein [Sphingomonas jeddahensis]|uniref:SURF1-like protein n=1 Tax=Sphingomonas jeddahensis TaxID=1915074 RepID=A0A1V2EVP9_9SPHN|nr:SURF1 family protein [Sphingomonas jeddahensis]ONF96752.1 SURF1 family protein [Sphingomonas jeddahensis]